MGLRTLSVLFLAFCAFSFRFKSAKAFLFKINTLQQSSISPRSRCPICSSPLRVHRVESGWEPGDGSDSSKVYAEYDQYVKMYDETTREKVVATRPGEVKLNVKLVDVVSVPSRQAHIAEFASSRPAAAQLIFAEPSRAVASFWSASSLNTSWFP